MLYFLVFCFYISLAWTAQLIDKPHLKDVVGGRIVNGEQAVLGQFPWQVAIILVNNTESYWFCGGSIISEQWILTAGHCVVGAQWAEVYTGIINLFTPEEHYELADLLILHEDYNADTVANDIALIKLNNPIDFNFNRSAIALSFEPLGAGVEVTVSGWGKINDDDVDVLYPLLNYIAVTTIDNNECAEFFGEGTILEGMVCTAAQGNPVKSPCDGDGGGPVVLNADTDPIQVAIVSFISDDGCERGNPAGYTRTAYYRDWIRSNSGV